MPLVLVATRRGQPSLDTQVRKIEIPFPISRRDCEAIEISCGYSGSEEIVEELKKVAKEMNLKGKVRVAKSGCLDLCVFGPNMMIWPDGIWYMKVTKENIPEVIEKYLKLEEADKEQQSAFPNPAGK